MTQRRSAPAPPSSDAWPETEWARIAVAAALEVPGVAAMSDGQHAEVATYGPGICVRGVRVQRMAGRTRLELHIVPDLSPAGEDNRSLATIAAEIRAAVMARLGSDREDGHAIHITFEVGASTGKGSA